MFEAKKIFFVLLSLCLPFFKSPWRAEGGHSDLFFLWRKKDIFFPVQLPLFRTTVIMSKCTGLQGRSRVLAGITSGVAG